MSVLSPPYHIPGTPVTAKRKMSRHGDRLSAIIRHRKQTELTASTQCSVRSRERRLALQGRLQWCRASAGRMVLEELTYVPPPPIQSPPALRLSAAPRPHLKKSQSDEQDRVCVKLRVVSSTYRTREKSSERSTARVQSEALPCRACADGREACIGACATGGAGAVRPTP